MTSSPTVEQPAASAPLSQIRAQIEYYFSAENLMQDNYLLSQMSNEQYIPLPLLMTFPKVKSLTNSLDELKSAVKDSQRLQLDDSQKYVRPTDLKVFELKSLRVVGMNLSGTDLQAMMADIIKQHSDQNSQDPSSVISQLRIHQDFIPPPHAGAQSWIVRCTQESQAQLLAKHLKNNRNIMHAEILRENTLRQNLKPQNLSPSSLKVNAKPFVPTAANSSTQQGAQAGFPQQRFSPHHQQQRHRAHQGTEPQRSRSVSSSDSGKQHKRSHYNNQNGRNHRRNYNQSNGNNAPHTSGQQQSRRNNQKGRTANGTSSKEYSNKSRNYRSGQSYSKKYQNDHHNKHHKQSSQSTPAPSLNANNYPTLGKPAATGETSSQQVTPPPQPGFSFADIATKAKDIAPEKKKKVAATTVPSSATSSESSSVQSSEQQQSNSEAQRAKEGRNSNNKKRAAAEGKKSATQEKKTARSTEGEFETVKAKSKGRKAAPRPEETSTGAASQEASEETAEQKSGSSSWASVVVESS